MRLFTITIPREASPPFLDATVGKRIDRLVVEGERLPHTAFTNVLAACFLDINCLK